MPTRHLALEARALNAFTFEMDSRAAFIALNLIEGIGPVRARSLLEHFGEAPKILAASKSTLMRVRNIGEDVAEKISSWEKSVDLAGELKRISDFGCQVMISSDENYPPLLRELYDPPLVNDVPIYKLERVVGVDQTTEASELFGQKGQARPLR